MCKSIKKAKKKKIIRESSQLCSFYICIFSRQTWEAGKHPNELSGGQSQRIAIARAIAPNPSLLLLDEPTSALDPEYTIEILDMIRELKEEGRNFIIVTHEMGFARKACDKTMFLHEGKILEYGESGEFFSSPRTPALKKFLTTLLEWNVR